MKKVPGVEKGLIIDTVRCNFKIQSFFYASFNSKVLLPALSWPGHTDKWYFKIQCGFPG